MESPHNSQKQTCVCVRVRACVCVCVCVCVVVVRAILKGSGHSKFLRSSDKSVAPHCVFVCLISITKSLFSSSSHVCSLCD